MEIAVIIRVHGEAPYLFDAVNSVLEQDCSIPFSLWLVLDRVAPSTQKEIHNRMPPGVQLFLPQSSGYSSPLNELLTVISPEYVAILDSDDEMVPGRLEKQHQFLSANPKSAVVGSSIKLIDEDGEICGERVFQTNSAVIWDRRFSSLPVAHPSVMYVRSKVIEVGGYRKFYDTAEDYDLWLRILEVYEINNLPQYLTRYRVHPNQTTSLHIRRNVLAGVASRISGIRRSKGKSDYSDDFSNIEKLLWKPRISIEVNFRAIKRLLWDKAIYAKRFNHPLKMGLVLSLLLLVDFKETVRKLKVYK